MISLVFIAKSRINALILDVFRHSHTRYGLITPYFPAMAKPSKKPPLNFPLNAIFPLGSQFESITKALVLSFEFFSFGSLVYSSHLDIAFLLGRFIIQF